MTPPASTSAGRRATRTPGGGGTGRPGGRGAGTPSGRGTDMPGGRGTTDPGARTAASPSGDPQHRRALRRKAAPKTPRRVSGPSGGRARAGAGAGTRPAPGRGWLPRPAPSRSRGLPLSRRALAFVRNLPDHALLDRIVRGRAWIPLLGVMLAGIVAMQVEMLKLGASIGRSIENGSALQSRNELLRASVATLADDQRIERLAAGMGMVMPAPSAVGFLSVGPGDARRAASNMHQPDPSAFLSSLEALTASSTGTPGADTIGAAASTEAPGATTPIGAPGATTSTSAPAAPVTTAPAATATAPATSAQTVTPTQTATPTQAAPTSTPSQTTAPIQPVTPTQPSDSTGGAAATSGG